MLVILVVNQREVQNRIIRTGRRYAPGDLQAAANYLNEICAGHDLGSVRARLLAELREHRESMNRIMLAAIEMADQAFDERGDGGEDFVMTGQTNLMEYGELADMERLRDLFEAFSRKQDILHLLDQSLRANGVQIFIGEESGYDVLDECSVVTAPYEVDGEVVGALGVIGPQSDSNEGRGARTAGPCAAYGGGGYGFKTGARGAVVSSSGPRRAGGRWCRRGE